MKRTLILISVLTFGCTQQEEIYKSPTGYDLNHPTIYYMPDQLFEISGIAFDNGNNEILYAEQDEEGKIFLLKSGYKEPFEVKFAKKGDYEDMAVSNGRVIVLRSDGELFSFPLEEVKAGKITDVIEWKHLLPEGEYESLYANNQADQLVLLCKTPHKSRNNKNIKGYTLKIDQQGSIGFQSEFEIMAEEIRKISGSEAEFEVHPSALTLNKFSDEWYILSSINKMLIVTDKSWKVKSVFRLDPLLFNQPEGIAFDNERALYISNEGSKTRAGTVLKFPYHSPDKQ